MLPLFFIHQMLLTVSIAVCLSACSSYYYHPPLDWQRLRSRLVGYLPLG